MATYSFSKSNKHISEAATVSDLYRVILHTKPHPKTPQDADEEMIRSVDCDEVYPNIYVGDQKSAMNKAFLQQIGITHVVNVAEEPNLGQVNTRASYYHKINIQYLGFRMLDIPEAPISSCFDEAVNFIDSALKNGGKVLIHCLVGISRSSTIAIAYIMIKKGMTAAEALRTVRMNRDVSPNKGFLQQLVELENKLNL
ncbi:dual specificity protein phosphatase 3-like [Tachypleus tridentatus]|uniref:dual specificity protein phosphatase 3-like n=1 Tax=Tachypleus tridentatus TaxID=6853 RepID=UPI003FD46B56